MGTPTLFPWFMESGIGDGAVLVDDILLAMEAEPTVVLDDEVTVVLDADDINVVVDDDIEIEVD